MRLLAGIALVVAVLLVPQALAQVDMMSTDTNAKLQKIPSTAARAVTRTGVFAAKDAPPLLFLPSNSACSLNGGNGDVGSQVKSADSKCWLAQYDGPMDARQFGADPTGVLDSAPPINAMLNLAKTGFRRFVLSPGTYTGKTLTASKYNPTIGPGVLLLECTSGAQCSFELDGYGAVIATDAASADSGRLTLDYIQNTKIRGLSFTLDRSLVPTGGFPNAATIIHMTDSSLEDFHLVGNWGAGGGGGGGNSLNPFFVAGDWWLRSQIVRFKAEAVGQCFDFGFMRQVDIELYAVGSSDDGTTNSQSPCFSLLYDGNFVAAFPAAVSFTTNEKVTIRGSVKNFASGARIRAGGPTLWLADSIGHTGVNCVLPAVGCGSGLYVEVFTGGACCLSINDPPHDLTVRAHIADNGVGHTSGGVVLDGTNGAGANAITNTLIAGASFVNNTDSAVKTIGTHVSGTVIGTNLLAGAAQTTSYDAATLLAANLPAKYTMVMGSGVATTPGVAAQYIGVSPINAAENAVWTRVTHASTLKAMFCKLNTPPVAPESYVFTARKQGVDTANTVTIAGAVDSGSNSANSVAFASGDLVSIKIAYSSGAAVAAFANCTLEFASQ